MAISALSLFELNSLVKHALNRCMAEEYWIQAELSDVRSNAAGHCYIEFIQKDPRSNNVIAKARGIIWASTYCMLKLHFEQETGQEFVSGIKVLVQVAVEFHEVYGYSLIVVNIDPSYTLGDMARRRKEILDQLDKEGVKDLNKNLQIPVLAQRVAVISSATAAGYGDFCNQLENNFHGFAFYSQLFPAIMQGERIEESVIAALNAINAERDNWDVAVIIRGGGAVSDLSGFDTYLLAANCAQFPLPIITGIGHERDDTVIDSVAHTRVKTPTAAADFLINHLRETAEELEYMSKTIATSVSSRMKAEKACLKLLAGKFSSLAGMKMLGEKHGIDNLYQRLRSALTARLAREKHRLELLNRQVAGASPELLLRKGYSITLKNGKAVTDVSSLEKGDMLVTRLAEGEVNSKVVYSLKKK